MGKFKEDKEIREVWMPSQQDVDELRASLSKFSLVRFGKVLLGRMEQYLRSKNIIRFDGDEMIIRDAYAYKQLSDIELKKQHQDYWDMRRSWDVYPQKKQEFLDMIASKRPTVDLVAKMRIQ